MVLQQILNIVRYAGAAMAGMGELAATGRSASPLPLFSLPTLLLLLFSLLWLFDAGKLTCSTPGSDSIFFVFGARHVVICQVTPVKVLSENPDFFHLLHGFPDLSRARSPALIAPWLALGPSL